MGGINILAIMLAEHYKKNQKGIKAHGRTVYIMRSMGVGTFRCIKEAGDGVLSYSSLHPMSPEFIDLLHFCVAEGILNIMTTPSFVFLSVCVPT